jgi:hypothetical protein
VALYTVKKEQVCSLNRSAGLGNIMKRVSMIRDYGSNHVDVSAVSKLE